MSGILGDTLEVLQEETKKGVKTAASQITGQKPKFVQDLYGGDVKPLTNEEVAKKEMADKQKEETLRQKLHQENYYQPLTTPKKRPEEAQKEEERAAERVERLEIEDLQEEEEKKKKKPPIAVDRAERKTEAPLGAG